MSLTPLSLDLYELWMAMTYLESQMKGWASFEFFVRSPLRHRSFLLAAGLETALEYLENFQITESMIQQLTDLGLSPERLTALQGLHFTGHVYAVPEGTFVFGEEPLLRIEAPLAQAQLIETAVINILQFQTLIASKAVRCILAGNRKTVIDFGLRRAHGSEAGLMAARACYIAGFSSTSNVLAGVRFKIPVSGTMAHSFIQAHDQETEAFRNFAFHNPDNIIFLLDTYDTLQAAEKVCRLAKDLEPGFKQKIKGVRLDSGDLLDLSRQVRKTLDQNQLQHVRIIASGGLDEYRIQELETHRAPIDTYAVGTKVDVSADQPYLDCAYKLVEYEGKPRFKLSKGKRLLAGRKQIYRFFDTRGQFSHDLVGTMEEITEGRPLLQLVMKNGLRQSEKPSLEKIRDVTEQNIESLPKEYKGLEGAQLNPVQFSDQLLQISRDLEKFLELQPAQKELAR